MKAKKLEWGSVVVLGAILLFASSAASQPGTPVKITVTESKTSAGVVYRYQVTNHSAYPITSVIIGMSYPGDSELQSVPLEWSFSRGIPPSSVSSPLGWRPRIITTEESNLLQLGWKIAAPQRALLAGHTLQGFSVRLARSDPSYISSLDSVSG